MSEMSNQSREIRRILIANRAEIARRIIRTCRVLDIETVAVYSDVDAHAPHTREATLCESIGHPMSYLSVEAIVQAAIRSGADTVHPGYGFLSENPALPEALEKQGIHFIGPSAKTIRSLGSKTNAKGIAALANVPVAPTLLLKSDKIDEQIGELTEFASAVGYPVIIKAAAGGGGRGMRIVSNQEQIRPALESAAREALKAFGSAEIFVERFISPARHIEVQIAGDAHGDVIALGTRDCSLQRSNQKIIEEAPAIGLKPGVDHELCQAACRLAKQAGYSNLGTVEFLYSEDGLFYFLEVNTRLQVEHPVTELVTDLDLVKLQIELAQGMRLIDIFGSLETPSPSGHSFEARLCAEEYTGTFVSSMGVILDLQVPRGPKGTGLIRADMGYEACSEVSHYYDSLLGKLIVHAPDRQKALSLLQEALNDVKISGVGNNRSLLCHLVATEAFARLKHTVQETQNLLPSSAQLHYERVLAHAIFAAIRTSINPSNWAQESPWSDKDKAHTFGFGYPLTTTTHDTLISSSSFISEDGVSVQVSHPTSQEFLIRVLKAKSTAFKSDYSVSIDRANPVQITIINDGSKIWLHTPTSSISLELTLPQKRDSGVHDAGAELSVKSPIPGKVAAINTEVGAQVEAGDILVVLDSMKMEHPFKAPRRGVIKSISVNKGALVSAGDVLITLG